jgi:hypothetical protein
VRVIRSDVVLAFSYAANILRECVRIKIVNYGTKTVIVGAPRLLLPGKKMITSESKNVDFDLPIFVRA